MVSSSPTTAPAELSRLTSPARPELLVTVIVWVPVTAVDHSGAQLGRLTVTALAARVAGGGRGGGGRGRDRRPGRERGRGDQDAGHQPGPAASDALPVIRRGRLGLRLLGLR